MANLEIHLHNCLSESKGLFKIAKSSQRMCSVKTVFLKILQNWQEITCDGVYFLITFLTPIVLITSILKSLTDFCQFYEIFENKIFTEYFGATTFE